MAEIAEPSNARSRRTRSLLLDAARSLLEEGLATFTIAAVAERAGVSRAGAYLHFESRSDLIASLFDHLAAENKLSDSMAPVWKAKDATAALDQWARHLARYHPPMLSINRAIEQLRRSDVDIAKHRRRVSAAQLASCRRLADWLASDGALAAGWTPETAADALYALIADDVFERLLGDRGWNEQDLANVLSLMLRRAFTPSSGITRKRVRPKS
jgi:AcrR family transcriptional regulator